ncbi:MAG: ASKHA domain-containing protein [Coriobacteriales bacterium]|jgi:uncharacterized 2Fe-2S/4Fe-4S cluster protein (DUF4445 family)
MHLTVIADGDARVLEVDEGSTILHALQDLGAPVHAACGGAGTCGKCRVLVRDGDGLSYRLACQTVVEDGMLVFLEADGGAMNVAETGYASPYPADQGEEGSLGLAFDIGTTTVVCHLHRLSDGVRLATVSCSNPQLAHGADVISRINASMQGRLELMRDAIVTCMRELADEALSSAGLPCGQGVSNTVIAGNTVMEHIACGLPPDSIGTAPFEPLSLFGDERVIEGYNEKAFLMPCIAGYVGGDITAGLVATGFRARALPSVFIDVGTNGEMVIGCGDRMIACATAAGPAFEGANITCGMPALPGAISRVKVGEDRLDFEVVGGAVPIGICGSALIDALAVLLDLGVVDETGRILGEDEIDGWQAGLVGEVGGSPVVFIARDADIFLTQRDIRNIQLAKAAICGGVLTLLDEYGIGMGDVDELLIAGGFGSHIDVGNAARIGLFPPELAGRARSVGNAAGEGASAVLVSGAAREALSHVVEACGYLELSTSAAFNEHYVECMGFE